MINITEEISITIVLDNGGGVTLQLGEDYTHYYNDVEKAAKDILAYQKNPDTADWDGNEPEHRIKPTTDDIQNGGYRVFDDPKDLDPGSSWQNEHNLYKALKERIKT